MWFLKFRIVLFVLSLMVLLLTSLKVSAYETESRNIDAETLSKIVENYQGKSYLNFNRFILDVYVTGQRFFSGFQRDALGKYAADKVLTPRESFIVHRLLGVYTRLKYGGESRRMLANLVSIPSFRKNGAEQHRNPNFVRLQKTIARYAKQFGLKYRNIDGRVYQVSLNGLRKGALIGFHTHADVLPANPGSWVLNDGTKLDPFKMTQVGDKFYGRGTDGGKNAVVAVMMAMRVIKEEKIKLFNNLTLLIDTTEESTADALPYFFSKKSAPDFNIALNGRSPVVIAEKGFGTISASFKLRSMPDVNSINYFSSVTGGQSIDRIPNLASAKIVSSQPQATIMHINALAEEFVRENGADFEIVASIVDEKAELTANKVIQIDVVGTSAHSYEPSYGVNPVSRLFMFIDKLEDAGLVGSNHITAAAAFVSDNLQLGYLGVGLGVDFEHSFMGPLTASLTNVELDDDSLKLFVNLRVPIGQSVEDIKRIALARMADWSRTRKEDANFNIDINEAMYRKTGSFWLESLLDIASENLGVDKRFGSSSNATSIHTLPNGVQFGLSMQDEEHIAQSANEFKSIDQFLLDLQIVTELAMRMGLMETFD